MIKHLQIIDSLINEFATMVKQHLSQLTCLAKMWLPVTDIWKNLNLVLPLLLVEQIQKYGDPNGVIQFYADSIQPRYFDEPADSSPATRVAFPFKRREGVVGDVTVS